MKTQDEPRKKKPRRIASLISDDGSMIEMLNSKSEGRTQFAIYQGNKVRLDSQFQEEQKVLFEPIAVTNNLIRHGAVVFAEKPEEYESISQLVEDIQSYIHRYLDVSDHFRKIASYYVLFTWVYDAFNEVPYLRLRGDFGSGKTRALLIIGSLCQKAFFASGASTISPIFHTLDTFRGTLIFDEADFRFSDEKSELVKIFNNGNVRGFPVLRTAVTVNRVFDPRAFNVFGPKIVAMRKAFDDPALESRFLTEEMGQRKMRSDIPINLPDSQKEEALRLRNQLLMYRFRTLDKIKVDESRVDPNLSPRLNQILVPLLSIIDDETLQAEIRQAVQSFDQKLYAERSGSMEAHVLEVMQELYSKEMESSIGVSEIASAFVSRFGSEYERPVSARVIGNVLRKKLRLVTYKSHGIYVVPITEKSKVEELCVRYGVVERENGSNATCG